MSEKEIAMTIVLKMLETKDFVFESSTNNAKDINQERLKVICNAYKTVYQTVKQNN